MKHQEDQEEFLEESKGSATASYPARSEQKQQQQQQQGTGKGQPLSIEDWEIRAAIRANEQQIKQRGRAVEVRWSSDKCQESTAGFTISRVLITLEILDKHCFDRCDSMNSIDSLYNKVFGNTQNKENNELPASDDPIILLLCEWAVCPQRSGEHRALVVAKLLDKRQADLEIEKNADNDILDEKESISSASVMSNGLPIFQSLLLHFLDNQAPVVVDDASSQDDKTAFANLVLLFCELIQHNVFSHDAYMCTLISRGDLLPTPPPASVQSNSENIDDNGDIKMEEDILKMEPKVEDMEDKDNEFGLFPPIKEQSRRDSSFQEKFLEALKAEKLGSQQTFKDDKLDDDSRSQLFARSCIKQCKHLLYAKHFPIPQDEISSHECNQRLVVLYGVGKARDEARHAVKKVQKEILKIINKKGEKENSTPTKAKKHKSEAMPSLDSVFSKFQALSYFDQHTVTATCANNVLEQVRNFHQATSYHLPSVDHITFIFDLMEYALNINGLLDFAIQLLNDVSLVEAELLLKSSNLAGNYTTNLCLCIVAVLRRYHACLLLSTDQTSDVFEFLCGVVKHVGNVSDCTSAERCILTYLYDLYISCSYLKTRFSDGFASVASKVKQTIYANIQPSASNFLLDTSFMVEYIENPRGKQCHHSVVGRLLNDSTPNRYSFVCNALLNICNRPDTDRLNDISILCAELTACCNALSSEWLGILKGFCCSSNHDLGFIDVLCQVDVGDLSIHDSIAIFTAILIARHGLSLEDVVMHVAIPSIVNVCQSDQDAEPGARLTCHLLLRLFKTTSDPNDQSVSNRNMASIKSSCDRHLLSAAHHSISVGPVLAVLKALLMLGDANVGGGSGSATGLLTLEDFSDDPLFGFSNKSLGSMETASLSDYAKYVLKMICTQDWVREKCLKDPENLCTPELLLDNVFTNKQAQHLLQLICYPNGIPTAMEGNVSDSEQKQTIGRILRTLNQWTLRVSWLELQLMFKQCQNSEMNTLLDNIAKATIEVFQQQTEENVKMSNNINGGKRKMTTQQLRVEQERGSVWLVAPLISKLPSAVQGRVLKAAGNVLESGHSVFSSSKKDKEKHAQKSMSLLSHQPFLSLVLTCLKGQDEQREGLLTSLQTQLTQFLQSPKDDRWEDPKSRKMMHEALQLRLSLVGSMFDTILRSNQWTTEFALLLLQLITTGTVDIHASGELFTTVLDMLSVLLNGTMASDMAAGQCPGEENKKQHQSLIKKLKKELGDKHSEGIDKVRQLLPLQKQSCEVITCETMGTLIDTKGNKIAGFDSIDKKQGLQVSSKQKVSPWDMLEGHKNPAPLSWAWFGAMRLERKPLRYEDQHRLLFYHTHVKRKPTSYYLEPPPLPPDEEEPVQPASQEIEKPAVDVVKEQAEPKPEPKKKRRTKRKQSMSAYQKTESFQFQRGPVGFPEQSFGMPPQPVYPGMQPQTQQQSAYFSQPSMAQGPMDRSSNQPGTKQALSTYLRARHTGNQSQPQMQQQQDQAFPFGNPLFKYHFEKHRQTLLRQQLRQQNLQQGRSVSAENAALFPQYKSQQEQNLGHIPQPSNVSGGYGNYVPGQPLQPDMASAGVPRSSGMLSPSYGAGYTNQPMMQQMRQNQGQYITQQQQQQQQQPPLQQQQPQQPLSTVRLQHQLQQRNLQRSASLPQQGQSYMQQPPMIPQQERQQLIRQRQQLLAMQSQQMKTQEQAQTQALVRQLQRQMSGGVPPQPQLNPYQQPPNQF
uniref:Mediator of RNA polymerase II transcription subunit 12-like protein-like n=1 Tax=Saccoglossus kowalevskii TaxID=10224 RepID=A0ABM0MWU0_SACKO|nr:PREDICTED: mediator of RNA polymerase II transcription subunit 12-like protein-like [Saccoglossus kowalevskii]